MKISSPAGGGKGGGIISEKEEEKKLRLKCFQYCNLIMKVLLYPNHFYTTILL
jgi:glutamate dehydrogenase/leucine dehydrogenase